MSFLLRKKPTALCSRAAIQSSEREASTRSTATSWARIAVPRHRQIEHNTARRIAKDLGLDMEQFLREIR